MANPFTKKLPKITEGENRLLIQAGINFDLASAAYNAVLGGLSQKYKLGEGDKIQADGVIVRKPKETTEEA